MKILVVVDIQNDFVDGRLGTKEAMKIIPYVKEKIENFDGEVVYTMDTHDENYLHTQEGRNLPLKHCIKGTYGWEIKEGVYKENCKIFEKRDKKTEYLHRFWAKQKITDRMARGLCFFRVLVYNRVAAVVAALFSCLKTRGTRVLARNCGMYFGNAPYRACHEAGPRQGDHKIGKICCYGRQSPAW